jgi:hypothetical protein
MTKNLNQALEKLNYENYNELEKEIELLEEFCLKHTQVVFSTFTLEKMIASEICHEKFNYSDPSEAIREPIQATFVNLLKETHIVRQDFEIPVSMGYSESGDYDDFSQYDYLSRLQNKFNNHVHKVLPGVDFSKLLVIKNLYKDYLKAREYYLKLNPYKKLIEQPSLHDFAENIKNSSYFNLDKEIFFES